MSNKLIIAARVGACFGVAAVLVISALAMSPLSKTLLRQDPLNPVAVEHRFTSLESKVDIIVEEISEIKWTKWIELLGLSGLMGEAGIRLVRRKP